MKKKKYLFGRLSFDCNWGMSQPKTFTLHLHIYYLINTILVIRGIYIMWNSKSLIEEYEIPEVRFINCQHLGGQCLESKNKNHWRLCWPMTTVSGSGHCSSVRVVPTCGCWVTSDGASSFFPGCKLLISMPPLIWQYNVKSVQFWTWFS